MIKLLGWCTLSILLYTFVRTYCVLLNMPFVYHDLCVSKCSNLVLRCLCVCACEDIFMCIIAALVRTL